MKKWLAVFAGVWLVVLPAFAVNLDMWLSSNTAAADTTLNLCVGKNYLVGTTTITEGGHGIFHGLCINSGVLGGVATIYNSSGSATNPIAAVATTTMTPCSFFDVSVSSGLTYSNSTTANLTILYQCY